MATPDTIKTAKQRHARGRTPAPAARTFSTQMEAVAAALELSREHMVRVRLTWPKGTPGRTTTEFELLVNEAVAMFLDKKVIIGGIGSAHKVPTPRLRRAMANTDKIKKGRFATAEELFNDLGQTSEG